MNPPRSIAALLALITSGSCHGAVTVKAINSCSGASITDTSIVEVTQAGSKWDIVFRANAIGDYFICGGSSDVIHLIRSDAANMVTVSTVGSTPAIDSIEEISGSVGPFNIGTIRVIARVGPSTPTSSIVVSVNNIALLESQDGALNGAVAVRSTGNNAGGNITRINFPQATIRADIRNDNPSGTIGQIDCKHIEGTPAEPVDIVAAGSLGALNVGAFDANGNAVGGDGVAAGVGTERQPRSLVGAGLGNVWRARGWEMPAGKPPSAQRITRTAPP